MTGIHLHRIAGDYFSPTLKGGDRLLLEPVSRYDYDGIYLLDCGSLHRADRQGESVVLFGDNQFYTRQTVPLAWFNRHVTAKALASVKLHVTEAQFERRVGAALATASAPMLEAFA